MKVKNDHRSKFSNLTLSSWKEEAWKTRGSNRIRTRDLREIPEKKVTGSNPVEALIISGFFFAIASIGKLTTMIILHFPLQPQFKYELFHIYIRSKFIMLHSAFRFSITGHRLYSGGSLSRVLRCRGRFLEFGISDITYKGFRLVRIQFWI